MKIVTHKRNAQRYIERVQEWKIPPQEQKKVQEFLNEYLIIASEIEPIKPSHF
jgi:hypothetical protein